MYLDLDRTPRQNTLENSRGENPTGVPEEGPCTPEECVPCHNPRLKESWGMPSKSSVEQAPGGQWLRQATYTPGVPNQKDAQGLRAKQRGEQPAIQPASQPGRWTYKQSDRQPNSEATNQPSNQLASQVDGRIYTVRQADSQTNIH